MEFPFFGLSHGFHVFHQFPVVGSHHAVHIENFQAGIAVHGGIFAVGDNDGPAAVSR